MSEIAITSASVPRKPAVGASLECGDIEAGIVCLMRDSVLLLIAALPPNGSNGCENEIQPCIRCRRDPGAFRGTNPDLLLGRARLR